MHLKRITNTLYAIYLLLKTKGSIFCLNVSPRSKIGNNVIIKRGTVLCDGVSLGDNCLIYRKVIIGNNVKIGEYTSINDGTVVESGSIGKACSLGVDCIISPGIHTMNFFTTSSLLYKKLFTQPENTTKICDDVWIGSRAIIMRGVTIGTGAVVGANAVVTKNVPPYAIVAGVPAKVIKYRFDNDSISELDNKQLWRDFPTNKDFIDSLILKRENFKDLLRYGD